MAQPTWITPAGSLGVVPESVFYQQSLLATVTPVAVSTNVVSTSATNNIVTVGSTASVVPGLQVIFTGSGFGGINENIVYYVLSVPSSTTLTITTTAESTTPVTLTDATGFLNATFYQPVYYRLIAGTLPSGVQIAANGQITGVPQTITNLQGVPTEVSQDITSKFVIRAYTLTTSGAIDAIQDRTFTLTITGNDVPQFVTPAGQLATYYDGDYANVQVEISGIDPGETNYVRVIAGALPPGVTISSTGLISGYIQPAPNETEPVGYDITPSGELPYDFVVSAISKNYQFTLEVTDGKVSNLRTYTIFVYNRNDLTGDNTTITADNTFVTADETTERFPFLLNFEPSSLGTVRSDNYFAYRFIGQDYDTPDVEYVITVNQGTGLPPGLLLDRYSGWYYGYIPDQGITEIDYSFNIQVRARSLVCTATDSATDLITADTVVRPDIYVGTTIVFDGEVFGGIVAGTTYYVRTVDSNGLQFSISATLDGAALPLSDATGDMLGVPVDLPRSQLYPFTLTVTGAVDQEVTWITDSFLGYLENGQTSLFAIEAENRGGRQLYYRLGSGTFNQLPQGLQLLPTGEIAGRASFNTFSLDLGETTIDASNSTVTGIQETTFDLTFVFTVNAYATDPTQLIYEVSSVNIINGGTGYQTGESTPVIQFSDPKGVLSYPAEVGSVTVTSTSITQVQLASSGAGYVDQATVSVVQGFGGTGAELEAVMRLTGAKEIVSVFKQFTIRLVRKYNKPYQNLFVLAMPPLNDRLLLTDLLNNEEIFVPEYIYRADDPNFGKATRVKYQHAFGLAPDTFETYVSSLYQNHYWKNLVLGEVATAQAIDPETGDVVYEVVYSKIVDDLVNAQGQSVSKDVALPYSVLLDDSTDVMAVYPNSLINMRDQVIDVVGQISTKLPLWMTSKQANGRVLGFTPAWVIAYTNPGRSAQIAYYFNQQFGDRLNTIDFKVDRYELDATLSKNWDAENQNWTPEPSLTTFDRINATGYTDLGLVNACTELAFSDINGRSVDYINTLGGLDGRTWVAVPGQTAPTGTRVIIRNGSKIVFVKQEAYNTQDIENAWNDYTQPWDSEPFDLGVATATSGTFDYATLVTGGYSASCDETDSVTDLISCDTTVNLRVNDKVWFTGTVFGGIAAETGLGLTQVYYITAISGVNCTATASSTDRITCSSTTDLTLDQEVWFSADRLSSVATRTEQLGDLITCNSVAGLTIGQPIVFSAPTFGNIVAGTTYYIASVSQTNRKITISASYLGSTFALIDANGSSDFVAGGTFGNVEDILPNGTDRPYYVVEISSATQFQISDAPGGAPIQLTNSNGIMRVNYGSFSVSETLGGTPVALSSDSGSMTLNYGNDRLGIFEVTVEEDDVIRLTLSEQTVTNDYVTSTQGAKYAQGTYLYVPDSPLGILTRIAWTPLIAATTVVSEETTFDMASVQWVEPVDMYDTSDQYDKYLVFPRVNILE